MSRILWQSKDGRWRIEATEKSESIELELQRFTRFPGPAPGTPDLECWGSPAGPRICGASAIAHQSWAEHARFERIVAKYPLWPWWPTRPLRARLESAVDSLLKVRKHQELLRAATGEALGEASE